LSAYTIGDMEELLGYLDVTPDHLIRLHDGSYVPACEFKIMILAQY